MRKGRSYRRHHAGVVEEKISKKHRFPSLVQPERDGIQNVSISPVTPVHCEQMERRNDCGRAHPLSCFASSGDNRAKVFAQERGFSIMDSLRRKTIQARSRAAPETTGSRTGILHDSGRGGRRSGSPIRFSWLARYVLLKFFPFKKHLQKL